MFFGLFGKKDHRHYLTQAGKHLAAERHADARVEFLEALRHCPKDAAQDEAEIRKGLALAGNRLGELNLREGDFSVTAGDLSKAFDHFTLAGELAVDETIRAMAGERLRKLEQPAPAPSAALSGHKAHGGSSCTTCKDTGSHAAPAEEVRGEHLSDEDRFFLLVQPLPGDLPGRYAALGEKFARAYLLIHDGNDAAAFPLLQEILVSGDNDIVICELALIMYRSRRAHECEGLLKRSLQLNPGNPTSHLALVHLLSDSRRLPEAIAAVERMMELGILADQAQIILGELLETTGDEAGACEAWSKALAMPSVARAAAERLVPILSGQGRTDEVKYLTKLYLKGCC